MELLEADNAPYCVQLAEWNKLEAGYIWINRQIYTDWQLNT